MMEEKDLNIQKNLEVNQEENLLPRDVVRELDYYIVGQKEAKKAVAIAIRNRYRRSRVEGDLKNEIYPKNIIMIGATGVGKTEISRRVSKILDAPFIKIEATKFTEVGYVGRDVESVIRDMTAKAVIDEKQKVMFKCDEKAESMAVEKCLDHLLPSLDMNTTVPEGVTEQEKKDRRDRREKTREKFRKKMMKGDFDNTLVKVDVPKSQSTPNSFIDGMGMGMGFEEIGDKIQKMFGQMNMGGTNALKEVPLKEAKGLYKNYYRENLVNMEEVTQVALEKVEKYGIVFIDEIDKIVSSGQRQGGDVSREGVQRDLLPLVEGTSVNTKYGIIKTEHILFIASGAFHLNSPSDLIPELQGRFPIRVELQSLTKQQLIRILTETKSSLITQYQGLLKSEKVDLTFESKAIEEIASIAIEVNEKTHDIGVRRLHTILEKLLEDILYEAPDVDKKIKITKDYVLKKLGDIVKSEDLSHYIL